MKGMDKVAQSNHPMFFGYFILMSLIPFSIALYIISGNRFSHLFRDGTKRSLEEVKSCDLGD